MQNNQSPLGSGAPVSDVVEALVTCPECDGARRVRVVFGDGSECMALCDACNGRGQVWDDEAPAK